jgi:hypothetical protein
MFMSKPRVDLSAIVEFDTDGALQETADLARRHSRRSFLRTSGIVVGGAAVAGGVFPGIASAATPKGDVAILNFALTLEYLESAFYAEALMKGALKGPTAAFAKVVAKDEAQHVAFLKSALGAKAVAKPKFDFQGTNHAQKSFQKVSAILETTGVSAYAGQGPLIKNKAYTAAALSIHSVEARHAAWINCIVGGKPLPAPLAFDIALTKAQVLKAVGATGFIVS